MFEQLSILAVITLIYISQNTQADMRTLKISTLLLAFALFMASCGRSDKPDAEVTDAVTPATEESNEVVEEASTYAVNTEASVINWRGFKPTGKDHVGTLKLANGSVKVEGSQLVGGKFVVDMNSLDNTDLKGTEGHGKLLGHLKSEDFFNVANHPTSSLEITKVEASNEEGATHNISGNLTIKGISKNVTFPATVEVTDNGVTANAAFVIDRSQWDVKFGSTSFFPDLVGDKVISNDLELNVVLVAGGNDTM